MSAFEMALPGGKSALHTISKRAYSAQPASLLCSSFEPKTSVLENKLPVLSFNQECPLARVTIAFKAGSRYETGSKLGLTNILRSSAGLGTNKFTQYGITRNLDYLGARLTTSAEREIFSYTLEAARENMFSALQYLPSIVSEQQFKPWELTDNIPRVKKELDAIPEKAVAIDLLHTAAYKTGLGNSLFCAEHKIGSIGHEDLLHYVYRHFTTKRGVVAGIGIDHDVLVSCAEVLRLDTVAGPASSATFYGGELRKQLPSPLVYYAVAGEAPGFTKKESLAYSVLSHIYSDAPPFKYSDPKGIIGQALSKTGIVAGLSGINASYSDSGLVGFLITASAADASEAVSTALRAFYSANITDADVVKGKSKLKRELLSSVEHGEALLDFVVRQVGQNSLQTPDQIAAAVDSVSVSDIKQAHKKLVSGKLAVGASGAVEDLPYYESLKA